MAAMSTAAALSSSSNGQWPSELDPATQDLGVNEHHNIKHAVECAETGEQRLELDDLLAGLLAKRRAHSMAKDNGDQEEGD